MSPSELDQRPRLLFLAQTLPFPPDGGVNIRTYNVLRLLARDFEVTALCFYRRAVRPTTKHVEASLEALREFAEVEAFPIPQEHSRVRLAGDHLRSLLTRRPYTVASYESAEFRGRLRELLQSRRFDLVHVDSLDLSGYLPEVADLPVVCVHHNVESALLRRRAESESSLLKRGYIRHQADLLEAEERRWCGRVALNVAVSEVDRAGFAKLAPGARFMVVPNGVDVTTFQPAPAEGENGLVFVGGYSWYPNRDALAHFCESILPHIRERVSDLSIRWVGRASEEIRRDYADRYGVELTGYVDDIRPHVHDAAVYMVPLRVGGGTRLKILDAWAMGKAVVSTSVGCEGLEAKDGENILIRDEPEAFAEAVHSLLLDPGLRRRLGEAARKTAEEVYSWDLLGDRMNERYQELVWSAGHSHPTRPLAGEALAASRE